MPQQVTVSPVGDAGTLKQFIRFPWQVYRVRSRYENWVPPLLVDEKTQFDPNKNPFFEHSEVQHFVARRDGRMIGRISAIVDHNHNQYYNDAIGYFGFFECIDEPAAAAALFSAAEEWLRKQNMDEMWGPMNPSSNEVAGLLLDSFDKPPVVKMPYNPPYYLELYANSGLTKAKDLYAYFMTTDNPMSDKIQRVVGMVRKRSRVTIRDIDMKHLDREIAYIRTVYNDAWSDNWGFVPWTQNELDHIAEDLKLIAIPDLIMLAFIDDEPVAFSLSLPDINQAIGKINGRLLPFGILKLLWYKRKMDMLRVLALGVRKAYRRMGIDAVLYYETYMRAGRHGLHKGEFSWVLENNLALRNALEKWGATRYKTYRIYRKPL